MPSTGFTLAGTGTNVDPGGDASEWTDPGNITADDDSNAASQLLKDDKETSHYLQATNFGFSLPAGNVPVGIEVRIQRRVLNGESDEVHDHTVQLIKGGTRQGDNNADAVTFWPPTLTDADYGGATEMWGLSLSKADVEAADFGVALRVLSVVGPQSNEAAGVDAIWINVHYQPGGGNRGYIVG